MEDIFKRVEEKMEKTQLPARILAGMFNFVDEASKYSNECLDPTYLPCYYYLGCELQPKNMLVMGTMLGLLPSAFLLGCKTVEHLIVLMDKSQNEHITRSNLKRNYKNTLRINTQYNEDFVDSLGALDFILVDNHGCLLERLNDVWKHLTDDGVLCIEHASDKTAQDAIKDFSMMARRVPRLINSRYGTAFFSK